MTAGHCGTRNYRNGPSIGRAACILLGLTGQLLVGSSLDSEIKQTLGGFSGTVSIYAKNLVTGRTYSLDGDRPVRTASTIKLPIMVECFAEAEAGKLKWEEPLTITGPEKVSGSGVVRELSDGVQLPIKDLMRLMIVVSDNTATNLILNRIGGDAVNARMTQLGLAQTRSMRKILGDGNDLKPQPSGITAEGATPENKKWGIGRSTPHEMVTILERLYRGDLVSRSASAEMIAVLKRQQDHTGIGRDLRDVTIASKSGALDHLRSDVAIVYVPGGPVAIAITVDNMPVVDYTNDNPGSLLIGRLSQLLLDSLAH